MSVFPPRGGILKCRYTFGVLTTLKKDIFYSNYHAGLLSGIFRRCGEMKSDLKLIALSPQGYPDLPAIFHKHSLDGLIILTWRWIHPKIAALIENAYEDRIVVVNDPLPNLNVNVVYTDVNVGMRLAVQRLTKKRVREIGMVHGPKEVSFKPNGKVVKLPFIDTLLKEAAFISTLKAKKIPVKRAWIYSAAANSEEEGYRAMKKWIRRGKLPGAIICGNDDLAFGVIKAMKDAELACPKDIAVIGFDDNGHAKSFTPPLTTIRQPLERMGRDAVNILLTQIKSPSGKPIARTYRPRLIIRKTA